MDNYQARAYAYVALYQLKEKKEEITPDRLSARMAYLMDMYSPDEIEVLQRKIKKKGDE